MSFGDRQSIEMHSCLLEAYLNADPGTTVEAGRYDYSGTFSDEVTEGALTLEGRKGVISTPEPLQSWFREGSVKELPIFHLHDDLWAMVAPFGLVDFRLRREGHKLVGQVEWRAERVWQFEASATETNE